MSSSSFFLSATQAFLLAEKVTWLGGMARLIFWQFPPAPPLTGEVILPALAAAVREESDSNVLWALAHHPLPDVLSAPAHPWHGALVRSWEIHRKSPNTEHRALARLALVRLDGCGLTDGAQRVSGLPRLLEDLCRELPRLPPAARPQLLAAASAWRPAPGVMTDEETLRAWARFWNDLRQSGDPLERGFAAQALLHLVDGGLNPALLLPPGCRALPDDLLRELADGIRTLPTWAEINFSLSFAFTWQPAAPGKFSPSLLADVARAWLEATHSEFWEISRESWHQLLRWERSGVPAACGIDLLPHLLDAARGSNHFYFPRDALLAEWRPTSGATPDPDSFRQLKARWDTCRRSRWWGSRAAGWLARIILLPFHGTFHSDPGFMEAYLKQVAVELDEDVLFVLSRYTPGAAVSPDVRQKWQQAWQNRLTARSPTSLNPVHRVAEFALYSHVVLQTPPGLFPLRDLLLKHWRQGKRFHVFPDPGRAHAIHVGLAAGTVPCFVSVPCAGQKKLPPPLSLPAGQLKDSRWSVKSGLTRRQHKEPQLRSIEGADSH